MKQILFIMIITINVFANDTLPSWIKKDPDNSAKYFRGISTWYGVDDYRMKELSQKDSLNSAYMSLGNYFGLNIKSKIEINKKRDSYGTSTKIKKDIKTKSNQLLFDIKPFKTYKEFSSDKQYFKVHILLKMDSLIESKIKLKMDKDKEEFAKLKQKVLNAIENKDFYKAENFLELAKGKRAAFIDDTVETLEKRLKKLKDGLLVATVEINKKRYMPKENINLDVSVNKDGYLYLFYDTGDDLEMLFPNKFQRKPKLKANSLIQFPNEDVTLEAYEESLNKNTKIYAIASKKNLSIKKYFVDQIDGIYIFEKDGKQNKKIKRCIDQGECTKSIVKFKVTNQSDIKVKFEFRCNSNIKQDIKNIFRAKGIKSQKSDIRIVLDIKKKRKYSSLIESYIESYTIKAKLYNKNKLKKEKSLECDLGALEDEIVYLYSELI